YTGCFKIFHGIEIKGSGFDHIGQTEEQGALTFHIAVAMKDVHIAVAQTAFQQEIKECITTKVIASARHDVDDQYLFRLLYYLGASGRRCRSGGCYRFVRIIVRK